MTPRTLNRTSAALLALGLSAAVLIYFTAEPTIVDPLTGNLLNSKQHLHELRLIGGHANVALAEFQQWFGELWRGRALAGTIAVLTLIAVLLFRFFAAHPELLASAEETTPSAPTPKPPTAS